jgi:hypothetical protein
MDSLVIIDQKFRGMIQYGTFDQKKIDSLQKLKGPEWASYVKKVNEGEIGFGNQIRDSLTHLQNKLDSIVRKSFIETIKIYGYPSFKRTKSYDTFVITLHLMGDNDMELFKPLFLAEVKRGNMPAEEYAAWFDRNNLIHGKMQLYGEYNKEFPCLEDLATSNQERRAIGLKPLRKNKCHE